MYGPADGLGIFPNLNEPMRVRHELLVVERYSFVYQNVKPSVGSIVIAE